MSDEKISVSTLRSLSVVCSRPVELNTRTGRYLVGCGKCPSCLNAISARRVSAIKNWAAKYKYCYMAVLTYAPEYLPYAQFRVDFLDSFVCRGKEKRILYYTSFHPVARDFSALSKGNKPFSDDLIEPHYFYVNYRELLAFSSKQEVPVGCISYANVKDYQNFTKRLRANIAREYKIQSKFQSPSTHPCDSYEEEKVRSVEDLSFSYYVVSEYGEEHNRPHWHFLLCFNSDFLAQNIVRLVSSSWPFGGANTSLSRGFCAEYLASYLGSYYAHGRLFDDCSFIRPRQRHSIGFEHTFFKSRYSLRDFDKVADEVCHGRVVKDADSFTCIFPTLNDYSRFFLRFPANFHELPSLFRKMPFVISGLPRHESDKDRVMPVLDYSVPVRDYAEFCANTWIKEIYSFLVEMKVSRYRPITFLDLYTRNFLSEYQYLFFKIFDIGRYLVFIAHHMSFDKEYSFVRYMDTDMYKTIVGRLVTWFRHLRRVCFNWHISNLSTLSDYCCKMANFVKQKDFISLQNFYRRLEDFNSPSVTDFLYNLKFLSYGTEAENFENREDLSENRAFLLATAYAETQIQRKKHERMNSHRINGLS